MRTLGIGACLSLFVAAVLFAVNPTVDVSPGLTIVSELEAAEIWGGGAGATYAADGCGKNLPPGCLTLSGYDGIGEGNQSGTAYTSCGGSCGNTATSIEDTE